MRVEHRLGNGLIIRQDYSEAVRFVMFDTGQAVWPYATHGGTAFIVNRNARCFAIICRHTLGDFHWSQLAITEAKFGTRAAGLSGFVKATTPTGGAVDSDILDIGVVSFSSDVDAAFFNDTAYVIASETICSSRPGDQLQVNGALKDLSTIEDDRIVPVFARFDFVDTGSAPADPVLREARAVFELDGVTRLTGLSGAPVFNLTQQRFCGIVVRGALADGAAVLKYVEASDIFQLIDAAAGAATSTSYQKTVALPKASDPAVRTR